MMRLLTVSLIKVHPLRPIQRDSLLWRWSNTYRPFSKALAPPHLGTPSSGTLLSSHPRLLPLPTRSRTFTFTQSHRPCTPPTPPYSTPGSTVVSRVLRSGIIPKT